MSNTVVPNRDAATHKGVAWSASGAANHHISMDILGAAKYLNNQVRVTWDTKGLKTMV